MARLVKIDEDTWVDPDQVAAVYLDEGQLNMTFVNNEEAGLTFEIPEGIDDEKDFLVQVVTAINEHKS